MSKLLFASVLVSLFSIGSYAQSLPVDITLNTVSTTGGNIVATNGISLQNGFQFTASTTNSMHLWIDKSPQKGNILFSMDNTNYSPYQFVRIGEYEWMTNNLHDRLVYGSAMENSTPINQNRLDSALHYSNLDKSQYQVNMDDFNKYYGIYYSIPSRDSIMKYGKIFDSQKQFISGWGIPSYVDFRQLFAMCPFTQTGERNHVPNAGHTILNEEDVRFALIATEGENPMAKNITDPTGGSFKTYFFNSGANTNIFGLSLMPTGEQGNGPGSYANRLIINYFTNGIPIVSRSFSGYTVDGKYHPMSQGDPSLLFYTSSMATKESSMTIHDFINTYNSWSYHFFTIRFCRRLSDQELGYKLYVKTDYTDIVKLGLNDAIPAGYVELAPGYLRGFYVQYILNGNDKGYTVQDIIKWCTPSYSSDPGNAIQDQTYGGLPILKIAKADDVTIQQATDKEQMNIYPNPVNDVLNIETNAKLLSAIVYDGMGRVVLSNNAVSKQIDMSRLASGIYILKVKTDKQVYSKKIIKK